MKLTKREKILLAILAVVLFWYATISFVILPALERANDLQLEVMDLNQQKQQMEIYLRQFADIGAMIGEERQKMQQEDYFYRGIDDVFVDRAVQQLASAHGVELDRLEIVPAADAWNNTAYAELVVYDAAGAAPKKEPAAGSAAEDLLAEAAGTEPSQETGSAETEQQTEPTGRVPMWVVNVRASGRLEDIVSLAEEVRVLDKSARVWKIDVSAEEAAAGDGRFEGEMGFVFYYLES